MGKGCNNEKASGAELEFFSVTFSTSVGTSGAICAVKRVGVAAKPACCMAETMPATPNFSS